MSQCSAPSWPWFFSLHLASSRPLWDDIRLLGRLTDSLKSSSNQTSTLQTFSFTFTLRAFLLRPFALRSLTHDESSQVEPNNEQAVDSLALPIPILADDVELVAGVVSFFVVDALLHALLPFGYDHDDVHSFS